MGKELEEREDPPEEEQDWTFGGAWPYRPRWFDTGDGRLHYVDVGPRKGRPVVMVHGNPTWGFLWRHFIPPLVAAGHRAIVPDLLGFGRSDKPDRAEAYTLERHQERMDDLLESLRLRGAVVVPHDWGGPIALRWAARHPQRVTALFILNTFVHRPPEKVRLPLGVRLARTRGLGDALVKRRHAAARRQLRRGVVHRERITEDVRAAYLAPHPDAASRTPILAFLRMLPTGPEGEVAKALDVVRQNLEAFYVTEPVRIVWGMDDRGLPATEIESRWLASFPQAEVILLDDAGHLLQEDAHERIVPALLEFIDNL